ncbi:MAG: deoxyguanosinetriphosphate triphosphohydrolase [Vampirovibrionales bacterium]|nr:deoxyguanosinetriphosphate triphosphohydrolase [Vampirovibrionales bacterium]
MSQASLHVLTDKNIREMTERQEDSLLHPLAAKSAKSIGRGSGEPPCSVRTAFQRDRDRITHSKAFRRLSHKTQVFIAPKGDHYRTRLTHSLEVAQVSRTIARALRLNEDLTEAIALGHDLGHPPFGHAGETILNELFQNLIPGGFHHQRQSLRIAQTIEKLNLSHEVLDGIEGGPTFLTLEAQVVDLADRMAYLHHDVEDARRAGMMEESDLPNEILITLGLDRSERLNRMVLDVIGETALSFESDTPRVKMRRETFEAMQALRAWMFQNVYLRQSQLQENEKVRHILTTLFNELMAHPEYVFRSDEFPGEKEKPQAVLDYIAGMTDRFAIDTFNSLILPHPFASGMFYKKSALYGGSKR